MKWIAVLCILYVGWNLSFYFLQEKFIFQPSSEVAKHPLPKGFVWENVNFPTSDGETLHGWWIKTKNADKTVLFFSGNAGNISFRTGQLYIFEKLGLNALVFDYRGYGQSSGKIHAEKDIYEDGRSALKFLEEEKNIPLSQIIFWGESLGNAIAIELAQNQNISSLILQSPFYSLGDIAQYHFPFLFARHFLKYHFFNGEKMKNISVPVLIFHSKDDNFIPFEEGQKLFEKTLEPKTFSELRGTHNRVVTESLDVYLPALTDFLSLPPLSE